MSKILPFGQDPIDGFSPSTSEPLTTDDGTILGYKHTRSKRESAAKPGRTLAVAWDSRAPLPNADFVPTYSYLVRFHKPPGETIAPAGQHYHENKNELFLAAQGSFLVVLEDRTSKKQVRLTMKSDMRNGDGVAIEEIVSVPVGTAHAVLPLDDGDSAFLVIADHPDVEADQYEYIMNDPVAEGVEADELLDLVDDNDKVIGQIRRGESQSLVPGGGKYVRAADLFIVRSDGRVWVPVRGEHKTIAPGGLDFSVGGHVLSGDTYEQTMVRELKEEAGISVSPADLELVATVPATHRHYSKLYALRTDAQPTLSDEHTSGSWMSFDELRHKLESGVAAKSSILPNLELLRRHLEQSK